MTGGEQRPGWVEEIDKLAASRTTEDVERLAEILHEYEHDSWIGHEASYRAALAMLTFGEVGIARLVALYDNVDKLRGRTAILRILYECYSHRVGKYLAITGKSGSKPEVDEATLKSASRAYRDLILRVQSDPGFVFTVSTFLLSESSIDSESAGAFMSVVEILRDAMIRINQPSIDEFRALVSQPSPSEAQLQEFFTRNPVFIDPLAREVIPKHALGTEYVTDFVVRTLSDNYVVVEIERPSDRLFTKRIDFTARLTHSLGQVLDFQSWIASNVAYARTRLPGLTSTSGLLIIGRSTGLDEREMSKLAQLNSTLSGKIRVATYDDILRDAERLLRNIIR